jgi:hypothetical protein
MKKHDTSRLIAGVAFGIIIAMLLILRVLGKTWDNIAVSILIGSLAGITLYDYRIITTSMKSAISFAREKMVMRVGFRKGTFWPFLISSILAMTILATIIYFSPGFKGEINSLIAITVTMYATIILLLACFVLFFIEDKKNSLESKFIKKIENQVTQVFEGDNYNAIGTAMYQTKCLLKISLEWYRFVPDFLIIMLLTVLTLLAILLQGIISIFLFIGVLFKLLGQNKSVILITLSVTIGTLVEVWQESYFIGLMSGLLFLGLNLMFQHIEINPKILFEKKYSLASKIFSYI